MRPTKNPDIPHPGKLFYSGQWRTPEQIERRMKKNYPSNNPDIPREGMIFWCGWWRTPEAVERAKEKDRQRAAAGTKNYPAYRQNMAANCERCGFVPEIRAQMDVHHKDGDHSNNSPENLATLCANCHRLEHAPAQRAAAVVAA